MLLNCSMQGNSTAFKQYQGAPSQYNVHKFMALNNAQVTYFITQVALAAASFGVAETDIKPVGEALGMLFNYKCSPPVTVIPYQGAQNQSICVADSCPQALKDPICPAAAVQP